MVFQIFKNKAKCSSRIWRLYKLPNLCICCFIQDTLVLHEQNSVIGRVNKIFMKQSNCIAFGFFPFLEEREVLKIEDDTFSDLAVVVRQMEKKKPILVYLGNPEEQRY